MLVYALIKKVWYKKYSSRQWRAQQKLHSQINIFGRSLEPCNDSYLYNFYNFIAMM